MWLHFKTKCANISIDNSCFKSNYGIVALATGVLLHSSKLRVMETPATEETLTYNYCLSYLY